MTTCSILDSVVVETTIDADNKVVLATIGGQTNVNASLSTSPFSAVSLGAGTEVYAGSGGSVAQFRSLISEDGSVLLSVLAGGELDISYNAAVQLQIYALKTMLKVGQTTYYTEATNDVDGNPTNLDKYTNSGKATPLFSRVITWTAGNATKIVTTDEVTGAILTVDMTYDINDTIETITEVLT